MFIREYLRVLIPLAVLMAVYRALAVPYIEPPRAAESPIGPTVVRNDHSTWWHEYFVEGSWQRNQPKILETAQGILLFEKWEKLAPDRWRLHPLTVLIPQKQGDSASSSSGVHGMKRRAIYIENPQGAEIQFREAIDWTSGTPPPVVSGQMNGPIRIFAPPTEEGHKDGMLIDSRDLRIDRRHIWTTQAVTMKIGRTQVEGRDLSIYMDQDLLSSKESESGETESPFSGLDHLELIYVDRVHIDLPDGGLFSERLPDRMSVEPLRPAHASIKCRGAFHFDFHQSLATLTSNVVLSHQVEGLPQDIFQSDRLDLHFRWNAPQTAKATKISPQAAPETNEWTIDRIEAFGTNSNDVNDPQRWVRLEAPSINARGQGRCLKVELDRGRIALYNHLPGVNSVESSQVYLQRDNLQVWSPEIEYENKQIGKVIDGNDDGLIDQGSLGQLWAAGPGQAAVVAEDGDPWRLSWAKSLQMKPDGSSNRLTIDGSANARSERQGRFSADTVDLWLSSVPEDVIACVANQTNGYEPSSVVPERLHAAGHVIVHSAELRAQVTDLQVWFSYPEIEAAKLFVQSARQNATPNSNQLAIADAPSIDTRPVFTNQPSQKTATAKVASPLGTAFSSLATIANGSASSSQTVSPKQSPSNIQRGPGQLAATAGELPGLPSGPIANTAANPPLPMNVTGETLVAKLSQSSQGLVIDDMALAGNVTVTRNQVSPSSPWPLTITGTQLRMDSSDGGKLDATIIGEPAKFEIGTGAMESKEIRFNERRQMVWIDQPGRFRIPPEAMQSGDSSSKNVSISKTTSNNFSAPGLIPSLGKSESSIEWLMAPEIQWEGRMVFDGRVARMDGGIKINSRMQTEADTIWHLEGKARELLVELEQPIAIGGNQSGQSAKVSTVQLREAVDLKAAQTDAKGNRRSLEHLEVPELTFLVPQQQWLGTGPGSLRSRRVGNANPGSPKYINNAKSTEVPSPEVRNPQAELQCLHLRFHGRMEGDMNQQLVSFHDRVETLIEPIFSWDQAPDVQLVDRLKIGQTTLMCDQLSVYNTANLSWNQTQIANQQLRRDAAWEVTGAGHVIVESVNDKGSFAVTAARAQYVALHSMLRIEGGPREAAIIEQSPAGTQPNAAPVRAEISTGAINLKTGEADLQITSIRANLQGINGMPNSSNNPLQPTYPNGSTNPTPSTTPTSPSIPSPRDSYPLRGLNTQR